MNMNVECSGSLRSLDLMLYDGIICYGRFTRAGRIRLDDRRDELWLIASGIIIINHSHYHVQYDLRKDPHKRQKDSEASIIAR